MEECVGYKPKKSKSKGDTEAMFRTPTVISVFNTAAIHRLSPFRVVIDGKVLDPQEAFSVCERLYGDGNDDPTGEATESVEKPMSGSEVAFEIPSWLLNSSFTTTTATSGGLEAGLLVPQERMYYLAGVLQRHGLAGPVFPVHPPPHSPRHLRQP